jgi:3',5'-cyclic AMP phosphodiesterase CpdA
MKIALVSDTHFSIHDEMLVANWAAAERWLADLRPDFRIHLGDISANGADSAAELVHARNLIRSDVGKTWFIPGNHDVGDHDAGPGQRTDTPFDLARLSQYRALFGMDRWSIIAQGWQFVGLNVPLMATGLDEEEIQFAWLEQKLDETQMPLGVFLHKPLFRDTVEETTVHTRYVPVPARQRLLDLLRRRDLRFVAAGHTHQVRQTVVEGVDHVWVPSTAFTVPDFRQETIGEKLVGVMLLEIDQDLHRFTHIIPSGMKSYDLMEFEHVYPALTKLKRP